MYGSETMIWKEKERSRIKSVKIDNLRCLLGVKRMNKVVWSDERIHEGVLRWLNHVERMENDRITKRVYASCQERMDRREAKLQKRKENYPFMPIRYKLAHRQTSTPNGFIKLWQPKAKASCQSQEFIPGAMSQAFSLQIFAIHAYQAPSLLLA